MCFPSSYIGKYSLKRGDAIEVRNLIPVKDWRSWDGKAANIGIVDDAPNIMLGSLGWFPLELLTMFPSGGSQDFRLHTTKVRLKEVKYFSRFTQLLRDRASIIWLVCLTPGSLFRTRNTTSPFRCMIWARGTDRCHW